MCVRSSEIKEKKQHSGGSGAVTHVMINDPTVGYGIFIDNMLARMPELLR